MSAQSLEDAMREACRTVGIAAPTSLPQPDRWVKTAVDGKARTNCSGRVMIFDDRKGGVVWNWTTQASQTFSIAGEGAAYNPRMAVVDREKLRRRETEQREVDATCLRIVQTCEQAQHPYLARKGFPDEIGLVHEAPWRCFPAGPLGEAMARAVPPSDGPLLIVPGRIGERISTVQFIAADGAKKNVLRGAMDGASHRIATGRLTVVAEGIATAMTVRAALRLLGVSATVLSAFAASNVASVASGITGAFIAADHDKPIPALGGLGTGEFYARRSGCTWAMPPQLGDWNDMHQAEGLRAVAKALREVLPR